MKSQSYVLVPSRQLILKRRYSEAKGDCSMKNHVAQLLFCLLVAAAITLACGSSTSRTLQSVAVTPATATAQSGQFQFTATGYYNRSPAQVTPLTATWGACLQQTPTTDVTVSTAGLAQCTSGASGTYTIWAFDTNPLAPGTANCNAMTACGGGCGRVTGTAQLTCP
jgi:hypothetical protein